MRNVAQTGIEIVFPNFLPITLIFDLAVAGEGSSDSLFGVCIRH